MQSRLRLYTGDDTAAAEESQRMPMPLGQFTRLLHDAVRWNRTWVHDFDDEPVIVSSDLYEILQAYGAMRESA